MFLASVNGDRQHHNQCLWCQHQISIFSVTKVGRWEGDGIVLYSCTSNFHEMVLHRLMEEFPAKFEHFVCFKYVVLCKYILMFIHVQKNRTTVFRYLFMSHSGVLYSLPDQLMSLRQEDFHLSIGRLTTS